MRAIAIDEKGGPEVLELKDVPVPEPGPGQVLVETGAVGRQLPRRLRADRPRLRRRPAAHRRRRGRRHGPAVGADVTGISPGDRVAWKEAPGSYAEQVVVATREAVAIPAGVSDELAAARAPSGPDRAVPDHRRLPDRARRLGRRPRGRGRRRAGSSHSSRSSAAPTSWPPRPPRRRRARAGGRRRRGRPLRRLRRPRTRADERRRRRGRLRRRRQVHVRGGPQRAQAPRHDGAVRLGKRRGAGAQPDAPRARIALPHATDARRLHRNARGARPPRGRGLLAPGGGSPRRGDRRPLPARGGAPGARGPRGAPHDREAPLLP